MLPDTFMRRPDQLLDLHLLKYAWDNEHEKRCSIVDMAVRYLRENLGGGRA